MLQSLSAVAAVIVGVAVGASDGPANAAPLACGETITGDTTLHADLIDCPNGGIVIGGDDITLNLNGHTIGGTACRLIVPTTPSATSE